MASALAPKQGLRFIGGNVPGDVSITSSGYQHVRKHNLSAVVAPGASNDSTQNYEVGSRWIDVLAGAVYECVDASEGAAVWKNLSSAGGVTSHGALTGLSDDDHPQYALLAGRPNQLLASDLIGDVLGNVTGTVNGVALTAGGAATDFLNAAGAYTAISGNPPGGSDTQVQFNSAGAFGGIPGSSWNGTTLTLPRTEVVVDSDTGFRVKRDGVSNIRIYNHNAGANLASGNVVGILNFGGHYNGLANNENEFASIQAVYRGNGTTRAGALRLRTTNSGAVVNAIDIAADGKVGVLEPTPATEFHVASTSASDPRGILSAQHSTDNAGAHLHFRKSRGTSAIPTTIVTGDILGQVRFAGFDGTNYLQMASIDCVSTGTIGADRVPTYLAFSVATNAAPSVLTERLRIGADGATTWTAASSGTAHAFSNSGSGATIARFSRGGSPQMQINLDSSDNVNATLLTSNVARNVGIILQNSGDAALWGIANDSRDTANSLVIGRGVLTSSENFSTAVMVMTTAGLVGVNKSSSIGAQLHVVANAATTIGSIVDGAVSQSANLWEGRIAGGAAIYGTMSENGYWTTRKNAAPADAELATGELAYWFDSTAGAAKVMFKGKNASGTVVTGQVALA